MALLTILVALAQLERELICERVRAGLANARAKGKHIGRIKKRDSHLNRKLLQAKLSYRKIAEVAKCSHGSIHAEAVALKKELTARAIEEKGETENPTPPDSNPPPTGGRPPLRIV